MRSWHRNPETEIPVVGTKTNTPQRPLGKEEIISVERKVSAPNRFERETSARERAINLLAPNYPDFTSSL